jgi:hypothetical protein
MGVIRHGKVVSNYIPKTTSAIESSITPPDGSAIGRGFQSSPSSREHGCQSVCRCSESDRTVTEAL